MASSSRFSDDEEQKNTEIIDAAIPKKKKKKKKKKTHKKGNHLECLFSMVSFLIQTGWAGSHCKSIASSELKLNIKRVRDCLFVFCFQIHALAYCTMNSKFSILHSASLQFMQY